MENYLQKLNEKWYAVPERENTSDLTPYCSCFPRENCRETAIPALVKDLFPDAVTPVWFYKTFTNTMAKEGAYRFHLCFAQVICLCEIWVNGVYIGKHRHSEEKFSFDVTSALRQGENLLACRVYGPVAGKVGPEGISAYTVPNFGQAFNYYSFIPKGGIYGSVSLRSVPVCAVTDLYVDPDPDAGTVFAELTLENTGTDESVAGITYRVSDRGITVSELCTTCVIAAGGTVTDKAEIPMEDIRRWSPEDPYLYTLQVSVKTENTAECITKRFGFRRLCIRDGWFYLNGKRIFFTCAHAMEGKEAVIHAKTMGFKALRYLTAMPSEELLDFCDEVGMMVYEECAVAWGMTDYENMPSDMSAYLCNMIRRDRSHPSVCIFGIFNEQAGGNQKMHDPRMPAASAVFDFAVSCLPELRRLDSTRLILLSSGRWDVNCRIGSYSNPGSDKWDYGWGAEAADSDLVTNQTDDPDLNPYIPGLGDNHLYPTVPMQNRVVDFIRSIGRGTGPVFLSEYGVGYQLSLYDLYRDLTANGNTAHPLAAYYRVQTEKLENFIAQYHLEKVYPTPAGFLMASIRAGAAQRQESIDPIRADPNLCGYSMTSFSVGNEGVYYRDGSFIPGITDALRDSFAPLKWSVFTESDQLYADTPFAVECVLCNEDALPAGNYAAVLSVAGEDGTVFSRKYDFVYPEGSPLAASVIRAAIPGLAPGEYTLSLHAADFRQPTCDTKRIRVHDIKNLPQITGSVFLMGDAGDAMALLQGFGLRQAASPENADRILVGKTGSDTGLRTEVLRLLRNGKRVYLLDADFFENANTSQQAFMQSIDFASGTAEDDMKIFGECIYVRNWLYHMDSYIADGRVFSGIAPVGLLDMDIFRKVYPDHYLVNTGVPDRTFCASFGSGLFAEDHCIAALTMGEFSFGKGSTVVSTFRLIENIGRDPVADRILYNILAVS